VIGALYSRLLEEWRQALSGIPSAQGVWDNVDGGAWIWQNDGLCLKSGGREWYSLAWKTCDAAAIRGLRNFLIEVTIQGAGELAGFSFGPFRDFLAEPCSQGTRVQLEVDLHTGRWVFRVDGRVTGPKWWNSAVNSTNEIATGSFALKARRPRDVVFQDLRFHAFQDSCRLSVILTCNRFLQRLRLALRNWCHQRIPPGTHEILIVNPSSPDGTHEYLRAVARSYPDVRVREVAVPENLRMNKGAMINRALPLACGDWLWFTDADCLFPLGAAAAALEYAKDRSDRLIYGQRRYLDASLTSDLLCGRRDSAADFDLLTHTQTGRPHENSPWGYTQIIHRSAMNRITYPESFNHFAHCDSHFLEQCKSRRITPEQMPGLFCLHLDHPFAWYGNQEFL